MLLLVKLRSVRYIPCFTHKYLLCIDSKFDLLEAVAEWWQREGDFEGGVVGLHEPVG